MKIALIVFGWAFLIWFALNQPDPPPQVAVNEVSDQTRSHQEETKDLSPPLPAATVAKIALIEKILTAKDLEFHSLWKTHSDDPDIQTLILEQWIRQDPDAAISAAKETKLELLAWKLRGIAEGEKLWDSLNALSEEARNHALAGIAENDPRAVIESFELQQKTPNSVVFASILHGLAKEDISSALHYQSRTSPEWHGNDEFETGVHFYHQQVVLWAQTSPEKALRWLEENRDDEKGPISTIIKNIDEAAPELLDRFLKDLLTGQTKARLISCRKSARKETKSGVSFSTKSGTDRKPETFLSLISDVYNAPISKWDDWLKGYGLELLPKSRRNLLKKIVIDRWIHHAPTTFPNLAYFDRPFREYAVKQWIEFDEESAIAQIENLKEEKGNFAESIIEEAILKTGKANAERFFDICEKYPEFTGLRYIKSDSWSPPGYQDLLFRIARDDREGLLKHARLCGDWGELIRMNLIYAWIEKDFDWVLARVQEWQMEDDFIWSEYHSYCNAPVFLDHFEKIPTHWRDRLIENNTILTGANLSWLKNPNPEIDQATLKKIFNNRQLHWPDLAYPVGDAGIARELVVQSEILSQETKGLIICHVLYDLEKISTEKAKAWLATLPPKYQQIGKDWFARGLAQQLEEETQRQHYLEESRPDFLLAALGGDDDPIDWSRLTEDSPENKEFLNSAVTNLSNNEALEILRLGEHQHLSRKQKGEIVIKAVESKSKWVTYFGEPIIYQIVEEWSEWEPSTAAAWVLKIPHQRLSENAVSVVYGEWRKYDSEEAEAWVRSLADNYRQRLGFE